MFQFAFCGLLATFFAYISQFKGKKHFLVFSLAVIAYIMGLQDGAAIDFSGYVETFKDIMNGTKDAGFLNLKERHSGGVIEIGWYTLNKVLGSIINSYHFVSFVASIFICCVIYKILKKVDSKWYWIAILYFYFINMQFCMSGTRQTIAMMCFILVVLFIIEKKWKKMLFFAVLGTTFHNSFIIILCTTPIMLIPDKIIEKHINKIIAIAALIYIVILLQSENIRQLLIVNFMSVLEENASDYEHYLEGMSVKTTFLNTIFRLLNFVFILMAFYYAKAKERKLIFLFLLSTYVTAVVGESSDLARINSYYTIFSIPAMCIIPSVIKNKAIRTAFILMTIVYIVKISIDNTDNFLFKNYNDFHTIIF